MAIEYGIDAGHRLLLMKGHGILTVEDILGYLRDVLARPEVAGCNELLELNDVQEVVLTTMGKMQLFAQLAKGLGTASATKLAIVAKNDIASGLGKLFDMYSSMQGESAKQVGIFGTLADALSFLDVDGTPAVTSALVV